jgi:hypothetical protein
MALAEVKIFPKPIDSELVPILERLLERARAGEVAGVVFVETDPAGAACYTVTGIKDRWSTIGQMHYMLTRLQHD